MDETPDIQVVIVGGGVLALTLAAHLAEAGVSTVVVGRGAASIPVRRLMADLTDPGAEALQSAGREWLLQVGDEAVRPTGGLAVARSDERLSALIKAGGEPLDATALADRLSGRQSDGLLGGVFMPNQGWADIASLCAELSTLAQAGGATVETGSPVLSAAHDGELWQIQTVGGMLTPSLVVDATGEVAELIGRPAPIGWAAPGFWSLAPTEALPATFPIIDDPDQGLRLTPGLGALIVEDLSVAALGRSAKHLQAADATGDPTWLSSLTDLHPALAGPSEALFAPTPVTADLMPLAGPFTPIQGLVLGIGADAAPALGAGIGAALARWIIGRDPGCDVAAVDVARFGDWAGPGWAMQCAAEALSQRTQLMPQPRQIGRNRRLGPLHHQLAAEGAVFAPVEGWEVAQHYGDPAAESHQLSNATDAALIDLSATPKFIIDGVLAMEWLDQVVTSPLPTSDGDVAETLLLNDDGRILFRAAVIRLGEQRYYLTGDPGTEGALTRWLSMLEIVPNMKVRPAVNQYAVLGLHGAGVVALLNGLSFSEVPADMALATAQELDIADIRCVLVRSGLPGKPDWEIHVPPDRAPLLFQALIEADGNPVGAIALDALRQAEGRIGTTEMLLMGSPEVTGLADLCDPEKVFIGSGRELPD